MICTWIEKVVTEITLCLAIVARWYETEVVDTHCEHTFIELCSKEAVDKCIGLMLWIYATLALSKSSRR